jgi:hypothetical protein
MTGDDRFPPRGHPLAPRGLTDHTAHVGGGSIEMDHSGRADAPARAPIGTKLRRMRVGVERGSGSAHGPRGPRQHRSGSQRTRKRAGEGSHRHEAPAHARRLESGSGSAHVPRGRRQHRSGSQRTRKRGGEAPVGTKLRRMRSAWRADPAAPTAHVGGGSIEMDHRVSAHGPRGPPQHRRMPAGAQTRGEELASARSSSACVSAWSPDQAAHTAPQGRPRFRQARQGT